MISLARADQSAEWRPIAPSYLLYDGYMMCVHMSYVHISYMPHIGIGLSSLMCYVLFSIYYIFF